MARRTRRPNAYGFEVPELAHLPWLDVRAVSRLSGFSISTLHMQFQREVYAWIEIGQQGRARRLDAASALHIMVTGKLAIGFGLPVALASALAMDIVGRWQPQPPSRRVALTEPNLKAVIGPTSEPDPGEIISPRPRSVWVVRAKRLADIERELGDELPRNCIVLDLSEMVGLLREAATSAGGSEL